MPLTANSLDERWLDFLQRSGAVTASFPFLKAVWQEFYKSEVEQKLRPGLTGKIKAWARPFLRTETSSIPETSADVLFLLESARDVLVEAIVPVRRALTASGIKSLVIARATVAERLGLASDETVILRVPQRRAANPKWGLAFGALQETMPGFWSHEAGETLRLLGATADSLEVELRRIFEVLQPGLLVLPVDQLMPGSSACVVAETMGVRSLVLLHGAVSAYNAPVNANEMAVWGEISQDQMSRLGVARERLPVLGSPRHDHPPSLHDGTASRRLARAAGCDDRPIFTFFSNGNDLFRNTREAVIGCAGWLAEAAEKLRPVLNILIRLHPNEDGQLYAGMPSLRLFRDECDLGTTLAGSAAVGGLCSTCLLEGLLYEKPVLQFQADGWPELADNWKRGLALRIGSAGDLDAGLREILDAPARAAILFAQQQLRGRVFANEGSATEAVAGYLQRSCLSPVQ